MEMEYKSAHKAESFGSDQFGLEIRVSLGRELTEVDRRIVGKYADRLQDELRRETVRLDSAMQWEAKVERAQLLALFPEPIYVEEIPNGYCSQWCCSHRPWFVITTRVGRIKIGWRKRVIEIDWTDTKDGRLGRDLFPNKDVTVGDYHIHAGGLDKAREYISVLLDTDKGKA